MKNEITATEDREIIQEQEIQFMVLLADETLLFDSFGDSRKVSLLTLLESDERQEKPLACIDGDYEYQWLAIKTPEGWRFEFVGRRLL